MFKFVNRIPCKSRLAAPALGTWGIQGIWPLCWSGRCSWERNDSLAQVAAGPRTSMLTQVALPGWPLGGSLTKPPGACPRLTGTGNEARVVCAAPEVPGRGGGTLAGVSGDFGDLLGPGSVFESLCCPWPSACTSLRDRSSYKLSKAVPINPIPVVWFSVRCPNVSSESGADIVTHSGGLAYLIKDAN